MISGVHKVVVPVGDQARAKEFWTEKIGFTATRDETYGDERWIEVTPPDGSVILVLSPGGTRPEPPHEHLPHSDIFFTCADIKRTHEEMTARGVVFPVPPAEQHFGWWSLFEDDDGT